VTFTIDAHYIQWRNWRFDPGGAHLAETGPLATV